MCAVPNMAIFCSSLILCYPGTLFKCFINGPEMVPVACVITGITFVFTFLMDSIYIVRSVYSKIFQILS